MRLRSVYIFIFILLAYSGAGVQAQQRQFGIGLVLFDPNGMTGKAWLGRGGAVSGAIGWSEEADHELQIQAEYLFYDRRVAGDRNLDLDVYVGLGGKIIFRDNDQAWIRVPLGLDFRLKKAPFNFFFEVAPNFNFRIARMSGAIGFRYIFGS